MIGLPRPILPVASALLLIAGVPVGAESQPGGNKDGGVGGAAEVGAPPASLLPLPQPAPDRPPAPPQPGHGKSPAPQGAEPEPGRSGAPTQAQSQPEPGKSPAPADTEPEPGKSSPSTQTKSQPESPSSETTKTNGATPTDGKTETGAPLPKNLKPIAPEEAVGILGKKVYGPADEDMGMVVDVVVDSDGRPRAAVIDFGGFLGVGSRKIAVDWELLQFRPADRNHPVRLSLGRAEVQAAPEYKPSIQQAEIVAPPTPADAPAAPDAEK